jgi:hypothetical protein
MKRADAHTHSGAGVSGHGRIAGAFAAAGIDARSAGPHAWTVGLPSTRMRAAAVLSGEWLAFRVDAPPGAVRRLFDVSDPAAALERNANLPAGVRLALEVDAAGPRPVVRAEVPLEAAGDGDAALGATVVATCAALSAALTRRCIPPAAFATSLMDASAIAALCATAGRNAVADAKRGEVRVALDVARGAFRQAVVRGADDGLRLEWILSRDDGAAAAPLAGRAVALLLLRAAAVVPWARPVGRHADRETGFELHIECDPSPERLDLACATLSRAAALCAAEAEALCADAALARLYVAETLPPLVRRMRPAIRWF